MAVVLAGSTLQPEVEDLYPSILEAVRAYMGLPMPIVADPGEDPCRVNHGRLDSEACFDNAEAVVGLA